MDNIRITRLSADDHADPDCRFVGLIQPDGGAWRLYIRDDGMPILRIAIELSDNGIKGFVDVRDIPEYTDDSFAPKADGWDDMSDEAKLRCWDEAREYAANNPGYVVREDLFGRLDVPASCVRVDSRIEGMVHDQVGG